MLSKEDNDLLTQVGPGTPMGNLLRRYWTPACLSVELEADGSPLDVRLLGEDLVAFRDTEGKVGLFDRNCPHRGASMFYARNEDCGLRCIYHGWKFDVTGQCVDMPSEPRPFAERITIPNYPVHESGGIVWTYMGPKETMTPFRDFGTEGLAPELHVVASKQHTTCSWVQAMEGNIDTAHISHLHQWFGIDDLPDDGSDKPGYPSNMMSWKFWRHDRAPRIEVQDEWYGFRYAGIRTTPNGNTHVRMTAYSLPYGTHVASVPFSQLVGMFVPIDDEHAWRYVMMANPLPNPNAYGGPPLFAVKTPFTASQVGVTASSNGVRARDYNEANRYQIDRDDQKGVSFSGIRDFVSQDLAVTESMGAIFDRRKEHLGSTDAAVVRMRTVLINAARTLAAGGEPPAVGGDLDYGAIRGAEKILADGEDWRVLGTIDDPVVQESIAARDAK